MHNLLKAALVFSALMLTASLLLFFLTGSAGSVVIVFLTLLIGPGMAILYPLSAALKIACAGILVFSLVLTGYGISAIHQTKGVICFIAGIVIWLLAGLAGLSTGT